MRARRPALAQQGFLAFEAIAGFGPCGLGCGQVSLRRSQRVRLVLRFEPGYELPRGDAVSDVHRSFDHAAGNAKAECSLVSGLDASRQNDGSPGLAFFDCDRANGTDFGRVGSGLFLRTHSVPGPT